MTITTDSQVTILPICKKLREDRPVNLREAEALASLKSELNGWIFLQETDYYFLLRFLRARGLNIGKTKENLRKYFEFRTTNKYFLDVCKKSYMPNEFVLKEKVPFVRTFDLNGRLVCIVQAGKTPVREIFEKVGKDEALRLAHYCAEYVVHMVEQQRKKYGCTKVIGIADLAGLRFRNVYFPESIPLAIYGARIAEAFYPEMLHVGIAINANWICHTAYKILKPFASEDTLKRVQIYGHEPEKWKPAIQKYLPLNVIPQEYGGTAPPLEFASVDIFDGFRVQPSISSIPPL